MTLLYVIGLTIVTLGCGNLRAFQWNYNHHDYIGYDTYPCNKYRHDGNHPNNNRIDVEVLCQSATYPPYLPVSSTAIEFLRYDILL